VSSRAVQVRDELKLSHDSVVPELLSEIERLKADMAERGAANLKEKASGPSLSYVGHDSCQCRTRIRLLLSGCAPKASGYF
jgi:hypothetical protein